MKTQPLFNEPQFVSTTPEPSPRPEKSGIRKVHGKTVCGVCGAQDGLPSIGVHSVVKGNPVGLGHTMDLIGVDTNVRVELTIVPLKNGSIALCQRCLSVYQRE